MFDHCLYFNTTALARMLEREWTQAFKPFGLTPAQAFMLRVVLKKPGLLQSEVAEQMAVSRSTATRTLDGLEKLGLIVRCPTERDGRELVIESTPEGQALHEAIDAASGSVTRRLKKVLGSDRFDETVSEIRSVRQVLD